MLLAIFSELIMALCAENEQVTDLDKLVMHCKHFPGLLASKGSLEQASAELDRTYEQARRLLVPYVDIEWLMFYAVALLSGTSIFPQPDPRRYMRAPHATAQSHHATAR
jgi:hypothetical protein